MGVKILLGILLVCAVGGVAAQSLEPLHIKTGLWEVSIKMNGTIPIPPEALAKMPPEQRAKIEERLKSRAERCEHLQGVPDQREAGKEHDV